MRIFAIDPGTTISGYVLYDGSVIESGIVDNEILIERLHTLTDIDALAIEMMNGMGMRVGASVFETLLWIGRFVENWRLEKGQDAVLIKRNKIKLHLCGRSNVNDVSIRAALINRLGAPGTKKNPGPTYGVTSHAWSALAVAVTCKDTMQ